MSRPHATLVSVRPVGRRPLAVLALQMASMDTLEMTTRKHFPVDAFVHTDAQITRNFQIQDVSSAKSSRSGRHK
jgi:hypothetical protein